MQGLAWLDSLHAQGWNGILADEMGLGKTCQVGPSGSCPMPLQQPHATCCCSALLHVHDEGSNEPCWLGELLADCSRPCPNQAAMDQVIALMAHLHETCKQGPLPFLVVVPASLIPNWEAELAAFAPTLSIHTYKGPGPQRAAAFQKQVLLALSRWSGCGDRRLTVLQALA